MMSEYISREELIRKITERRIANSMCLASDKAKPPEQTYFKHLLFEDDRALEIAKEIPTAEVIKLDRVKQAREEIKEIQSHIQLKDKTTNEHWIFVDKFEVLAIIDKLIAESEDKK